MRSREPSVLGARLARERESWKVSEKWAPKFGSLESTAAVQSHACRQPLFSREKSMIICGDNPNYS
jgi:hypothetical protein